MLADPFVSEIRRSLGSKRASAASHDISVSGGSPRVSSAARQSRTSGDLSKRTLIADYDEDADDDELEEKSTERRVT